MSSAPPPDVGVVIVTHNSVALLPACFDSLTKHRGAVDTRIVVSDSGSTDAVGEVSESRGVHCLRGPNLGFGAAINRALAVDPICQARYVLVVNPDVEIKTSSVAELVSLCDQRPRSAVFGTRQVDQHGRLICTMGRAPTPGDYWRAARTLSSDWVRDREQYDDEQPCDWVVGSFMLIRRQVLEEIGGFDERFFLNSEEVDLCRRTREAGWTVAFLPQMTVMHHRADRLLNEHAERLVTWSKILYIRKWYGPLERISMRAALIALIVRRLLRSRRRGEARLYRVRLGAALWFRASLYGPSPLGEDDAVDHAPSQAAEGQSHAQLDPAQP
jgi:N-acetylglucosaminyl-diphospho-decaprenol L-rhamnosyltransferase